ncbi:putative glycoside hydrolase [Ferviditalea candida]|uniref:Glycoside hydrolase n=1 Tax=Ferviditalea candida TaxID=3108399 RepID=A0ABU5ZEY3_9BACL|nr:putative glycoside hydrolase [Paenibacillaceae bacterium T2]
MGVLLASLLFILGNLSADKPAITFEQLAQAAVASKQQAVQQPANPQDQQKGSEANSQPSADSFVKQDPQPEAPIVKGIYSTANSAGGAKLNSLIKLIDETDLNSIVIDLKDDFGYITFDTDNPKLKSYGSSKKIIPDIHQLMDTLKQHNIYPIARIVAFKDTVLAKKRPDLSFVNPDGSLWNNGKKPNPDSFVNPYMQEVWEYNVEVAKEAAKLGFKEIQFDYVRFPEGFEKKADKLKYSSDDRKRIQVVSDFVKYAREQLNPLGVRTSVDIFGYAASVPAAEGIGQDFNAISKYVDVICPMVYPSHYSAGWFGSKVPDTEPYKTINGAMIDTHKKLEAIGAYKPIIRPWIQDFTASWLPVHITYGKKEVEAQIRALEDNHIQQFLLWNATNRYTPGVNYERADQSRDKS